jgi:hypothetical protein
MGRRSPAGQGRAQGSIETLPSGALRVRVYAGIDSVSGRRHYLSELVKPGPKAEREAEDARKRLLSQIAERRNPRTSATVDQLLDRYLDLLDGAEHADPQPGIRPQTHLAVPRLPQVRPAGRRAIKLSRRGTRAATSRDALTQTRIHSGRDSGSLSSNLPPKLRRSCASHPQEPASVQSDTSAIKPDRHAVWR